MNLLRKYSSGLKKLQSDKFVSIDNLRCVLELMAVKHLQEVSWREKILNFLYSKQHVKLKQTLKRACCHSVPSDTYSVESNSALSKHLDEMS